VVHVRDISGSTENGVHRVRADADGSEIWFESSDVALRAAPEAFGTALLLPALHGGTALSIDAPVDPDWLANTAHILPTFRRWWRYAERTVQVPGTTDAVPREHSSRHASPREPDARTALCFSAGVDSFHSLLNCGERPGVLVAVQGFDIRLDDSTRWSAFEASVREVAAAVGARAVIVRTNLRDHPTVALPSWERAHGGALAAVAHLLDDGIDRLLVSSSIPFHWNRAWGSHWQVDPYWSSSRVSVHHVGAQLQRRDKLPRIAANPLVRKHLRVCWENRSPTGNCRLCEKCVRTELVLRMHGQLEHFPGFSNDQPLAERLDRIAASVGRGMTYRTALQSGRMEPDVERALRRLIRRTQLARVMARVSFGRWGRSMVP